jgi:RNA polymerase sigma-70 factor (ECF subfamily)
MTDPEGHGRISADALRAVLEASGEDSLGVPDGVFVSFLADRARDGRVPLQQLQLEDLRLTCAAWLGIEAAVTRLRRLIRRASSGIDPRRREDLEAKALDRLLVGPPPKLLEYSGRGPLAVWLKMVMRRLDIDTTRREAREAAAVAPLHAAWSSVVQSNPELKLMRASSKRELERALAEAHASLNDRERMMLRLHYLQGVPHHELGRQLGMPRSTVAHHIARARERLLLELHRRLQERLKLTDSDVHGLIGVVSVNLELSFLGGPVRR